jgi:tetratricopeptide (TPR) repeat protein
MKFWCHRGNAIVKLNNADEIEAIENFDQALQIKQDYHEAWNARGVTLYKLGDYDGAIENLIKLCKSNPTINHI